MINGSFFFKFSKTKQVNVILISFIFYLTNDMYLGVLCAKLLINLDLESLEKFIKEIQLEIG